jgi:hypothetical protein
LPASAIVDRVDELIQWASPVTDQLQSLAEDPDGFRFEAATVPELPAVFKTDRIVIRTAWHHYDGAWRADCLHVYATKPTLRALGVAVLASLFAPPRAVTAIALSDPRSDIRTIHLTIPSLDRPGLVLRPHALEYWPAERAKHPWYPFTGDPWNLPMVLLTDADDDEVGEDDWASRDMVEGFGTFEGIARFAELLLDVSDPAANRDEYVLEGEAGLRGVSPMSAELVLWLPGSVGWSDEWAPTG